MRLPIDDPKPIETRTGKRLLDRTRNQAVPDTPEERVRQRVLRALTETYGYPLETLRSEEPVAPGTDNRGRADIIIVLPRGGERAASLVERPADSATTERPYSVRADEAAQKFPDAGFSVVKLPDELELSIDRQRVACTVRGFWPTPSGDVLVLTPKAPVADLPPKLVVRVSPHGQTSWERDLVRRLKVPSLAWAFDASREFLDFMMGDETLPTEERDFFELTVRSADGNEGTMLLPSDVEGDEHAVLLHVDVDEHVDAVESADEPRPAFDVDDLDEDDPTEPPNDARVRDDWRLDHDAVVVIECKSPGTELTEHVRKQAMEYAGALGARFVVTVNGPSSQVWEVGDEAHAIDDLPSYADLTSKAPLKLRAVSPRTWGPRLPADIAERPDAMRFFARYRDIVGHDTREPRWLPILALDDALFEQEHLQLPKAAVHGIRFVKDLGEKRHTTGSPVGAGFTATFRDFLLEAPGGESFVLGLTITPHVQWPDKSRASGTRVHTAPCTYLVVGLSDDAEYASSLELRFDVALQDDGSGWKLIHNGALTAGKGGVKRERLFERLEAEAAHLLEGGRVLLGRLPDGPEVPGHALWDLVARIATYVLVRRRLKDEVKQERARAKKRSSSRRTQ